MIEINSKKYEPKEFTLRNYPECITAIKAFNKETEDIQKWPWMIKLFKAAMDIDDAEAKAFTISQALELYEAITTVGMPAPKVKPAPASQAEPELNTK